MNFTKINFDGKISTIIGGYEAFRDKMQSNGFETYNNFMSAHLEPSFTGKDFGNEAENRGSKTVYLDLLSLLKGVECWENNGEYTATLTVGYDNSGDVVKGFANYVGFLVAGLEKMLSSDLRRMLQEKLEEFVAQQQRKIECDVASFRREGERYLGGEKLERQVEEKKVELESEVWTSVSAKSLVFRSISDSYIKLVKDVTELLSFWIFDDLEELVGSGKTVANPLPSVKESSGLRVVDSTIAKPSAEELQKDADDFNHSMVVSLRKFQVLKAAVLQVGAQKG